MDSFIHTHLMNSTVYFHRNYEVCVTDRLKKKRIKTKFKKKIKIKDLEKCQFWQKEKRYNAIRLINIVLSNCHPVISSHIAVDVL